MKKGAVASIVLIAFIIAPILYLYDENPAKSFLIVGTLFLWLGIALLSRSFIYASLLYLIVVLPLNITVQIPGSLGIYDPYVNGILVNYLVPTISILDIAVILILFAIVIEHGTDILDLKLRLFFTLLALYLFIHNFYFKDFNVLYNSLRILIYAVTFFIFKDVLLQHVDNFFNYGRKRLNIVGVILIFSVIFQGTLGYLQFVRRGVLGLAVLGESQIVTGAIGSSFVNLQGDLYLRAYGTFPHPNVLAGFLLFTFVLFAGIFLYSSRYKRTSLFMMVFISFSILFTFSRVPLVLLAVCWCVILLQRIKLYRGKEILALPILIPDILTRFRNALTGGDVSWFERSSLNKAALLTIIKNPVEGVGIGNFVKTLAENPPLTGPGIALFQPVHNIFLLIIAENGLIFGLMICTALFLYMLNGLITSSFRVMSFLLSLIIISVGNFDHYFLTLPQGLTLFFLLLTMQQIKLNNENHASSNSSSL